ncbi:hypothetical protein PMAYCL1PPCAC_01716, partial [Pristionchus mayeri]
GSGDIFAPTISEATSLPSSGTHTRTWTEAVSDTATGKGLRSRIQMERSRATTMALLHWARQATRESHLPPLRRLARPLIIRRPSTHRFYRRL